GAMSVLNGRTRCNGRVNSPSTLRRTPERTVAREPSAGMTPGADLVGSAGSGARTDRGRCQAVRRGASRGDSNARKRLPRDTMPSLCSLRSVTSAGLDPLPVMLVQATLLPERVAGRGHVVCECGRQAVAQRQLDECPHDRDVVRIGRQRVGGRAPAPLRGELGCYVEFVVVVLSFELEGDERELLGIGVANKPELSDAVDPLGSVGWG